MREFKFKVVSGDSPTLSDTICSGNGSGRSPVDLTGSTVNLLVQGPGVEFSEPATIVNATTGQVQYQFPAPQTAVSGDYFGEWEVTFANGDVMTYPPQGFQFQILPSLPLAEPASFTKLSDFYDDIRAIVGDFKKRVYQDSAIASAMRVLLNQGKINQQGQSGGKCSRLGPDKMTLSQPMMPQDVQAYALLVYKSAKMLMLPNAASYSFRTRELSERFGEQKDFLMELEMVIYDLEGGNQVWASITGLQSWLFAINGIWVWSYLQAERQIDLSFR